MWQNVVELGFRRLCVRQKKLRFPLFWRRLQDMRIFFCGEWSRIDVSILLSIVMTGC